MRKALIGAQDFNAVNLKLSVVLRFALVLIASLFALMLVPSQAIAQGEVVEGNVAQTEEEVSDPATSSAPQLLDRANDLSNAGYASQAVPAFIIPSLPGDARIDLIGKVEGYLNNIIDSIIKFIKGIIYNITKSISYHLTPSWHLPENTLRGIVEMSIQTLFDKHANAVTENYIYLMGRVIEEQNIGLQNNPYLTGLTRISRGAAIFIIALGFYISVLGIIVGGFRGEFAQITSASIEHFLGLMLITVLALSINTFLPLVHKLIGDVISNDCTVGALCVDEVALAVWLTPDIRDGLMIYLLSFFSGQLIMIAMSIGALLKGLVSMWLFVFAPIAVAALAIPPLRGVTSTWISNYTTLFLTTLFANIALLILSQYAFQYSGSGSKFMRIAVTMAAICVIVGVYIDLLANSIKGMFKGVVGSLSAIPVAFESTKNAISGVYEQVNPGRISRNIYAGINRGIKNPLGL